MSYVIVLDLADPEENKDIDLCTLKGHSDLVDFLIKHEQEMPDTCYLVANDEIGGDYFASIIAEIDSVKDAPENIKVILDHIKEACQKAECFIQIMQ